MADLSPLRRRMIEDMTVPICRRRRSDRTSARFRSSAVISANRRIGWNWKTFAPFKCIWSRPAYHGRR